MKRLFLLGMVLVVVFLISCSPTKTITSDQGTVKVKPGVLGPDWCKTGTQWKFTGKSPQQGNAQWNIKELVSSGEFRGLCHVVYVAGANKMDYYFSKDGKSGYIEMNINGQKIKQKWSG